MNCLLCEGPRTEVVLSREQKPYGLRQYRKCTDCALIFLDPACRLNASEEKARYDTHQNDVNDAGYQKFLLKLVGPLQSRLAKGAVGLDYGCGQAAAIKTLMSPMGVSVYNYDPYYFPGKEVLRQKYDFITLSEVAEHFNSPREEFSKINRLLKSESGMCAVMTQMADAIEKLDQWWYFRDPTHVSFYSQKTCEWIADWLNWELERIDASIVFFHRRR